MLLGALIVLLPNFYRFQWGDILILIAALIAPFGNFFQRRARRRVGSETIMFVRSGLTALVIFIVALLVGEGISLPAITKSVLVFAYKWFGYVWFHKNFMAGRVFIVLVSQIQRSFRRLALIYPYFRLADFKTISHFLADVVYFTDVYRGCFC